MTRSIVAPRWLMTTPLARATACGIGTGPAPMSSSGSDGRMESSGASSGGGMGIVRLLGVGCLHVGLGLASRARAGALVRMPRQPLERRDRAPAQVRPVEADDLGGGEVRVLRLPEVHQSQHLFRDADRTALEPEVRLVARRCELADCGLHLHVDVVVL